VLSNARRSSRNGIQQPSCGRWLLWDKLKMIVEPSSAVPLAMLLERKISLDKLRVGVILSGGNVDLDRLPWQA
jgi:threonine dehydratase